MTASSSNDGIVTKDGADGALAPSMPFVSRVLVVDDEPMIVSFVSRALSAEGFQVDSAMEGSRGLEMASTG